MKVKDVIAQESASKRQKILKRIYHAHPGIFDNHQALMIALEHEGYFKVCARLKESPEELLAFDMSQILMYHETHHDDLLNSFNHIIVYITAQNSRKQKQLFKVALTYLALSYFRMTYRIGAAARPRVELQKTAFGTAVKLECQNAALDELCLQGFGVLNRGRSHEATAKLNEERKSEGLKPLRSQLSFFEFAWRDEVAPQQNFLQILVSLKLVSAELLEYSHLNPEKQFAALMESLKPGVDAFDAYCGSASIRSAFHRQELSHELYTAKQEDREPKQIKRDYRPVKEEPVIQEPSIELPTEDFSHLLEVELPDVAQKMAAILAERRVMTDERVAALTAGLEF